MILSPQYGLCDTGQWLPSFDSCQLTMTWMSAYKPSGHQARACPIFSSTKQLGVYYSPLDEMLVLHRVTPSIKLAGTCLYTCVETGTLIVSCPRTQCPRPGLEPGLLHPETSTQTMSHHAFPPMVMVLLSYFSRHPLSWRMHSANGMQAHV